MGVAAAMPRLIDGWFRGFLGTAVAAVCAVGGPAPMAAPLQLVTDQLLPFENLSDAEAPGFSTEVLRHVFAAMGQEASFEEFPWARALRLVFRGERDALFTALRNEERARFCYFPDEPLLREKWVFFVRAADVGRLKFSSFEDLVGHHVAVLRGAAVSPEFWNFVHQHRNFSETGSGEANFRMLQTGRVDYAVLSFSQGIPIRLQKPIDTGYGPYADGFSTDQHKFGPFEPIRVRVKELAAASGTTHAGGPDHGSDETDHVK
jgi:polar amino acid transport system substrate-binding protein